MLAFLTIYDYDNPSIVYYTINPINENLEPNSYKSVTYNNNTGSLIIQPRALVVELNYFNMTTGGSIITKKALKPANTIGGNMLLQGIEDDNIIEDVIIDNFSYDLNTNKKEAKLRNGSQEMYSGDIIIPMSVTYLGEDYKVTSVKEGAFSKNTNITSVFIPSSIKAIESSAFCGCLKLTHLSIADGLEEIGDYAFSGCDGLNLVTLPNSVNTIGSKAFYACHNLTTLIFGSGISSIGYEAFYGCDKIQNVYCYAVRVPSASLSFDSSVLNATLHVPFYSLSSYKWDWNWRNYKNIVAITDSDPKPTIIRSVTYSHLKSETFFTLDGQLIDKKRKGINIIILKDGTVKKLINW